MSKFIPNSFQVPNALVDLLMAGLSGNAIKCYLLVARQTTGWHKEMDFIPIAQFKQRCGIKKEETVTEATAQLVQFGLIEKVEQRGKVTGYKLNFAIDDGAVHPKMGGTTTPDKLVHPKNGTTPENWGYPPPKMGGTTTPDKRGTSKDTTKPTIQNTTTTTPAPAETHTAPAAYGDTPTLPTEAFAMHLDWQPQNLQAVNSLLRMAGLPMFDRNDANLNAAFADFVGFWFAKPDTLRTAREWDVRFAQSAVEYWRKHYCPHPAYQQRQDDWGQGEARLKGEGVPEQLASEHMALRRAKRVPLTDTALNALKAEAAKAGLSLADVVRHMVQNNWVRFEAAWLNKAGNGFTPTVREVTQAQAGSGGIIDPRTGQQVAVEIEVNADEIDF